MRSVAQTVLLVLAAAALAPTRSAAAGQDPHEHQHPPSAPPSDEHAAHDHSMTMEAGPPGIPESRSASGTAWQPDSTPTHGLHFMKGPWMLMAHWNLFAGYDHQGSDRGGSQWIATNWAMLMESRAAGGGQLVLRQMLTIEPLTVGTDGYPLLLQTGETFEGQPLHDKQHPHDLFMELAALYEHPISKSLAFQVYGAPVGEPALGPVAFPHRHSAFSDPLAALSHHWQDSTHISFGVLTAGLFTSKWKVEGSWFNGREPDEHRYDFDFRGLDSYSGRVSFNPCASFSLQASYGYVDSPEELHPDVSVHRLTASASYARPMGESGSLAALAVMGRNDPSGHPQSTSWLLEANYATGGRSTWFGRAERVEKGGEDLDLPAPLDGEQFPVTSLVGGYEYRLFEAKGFAGGLGTRVSVNFIDDALEPFYGSKSPAGYMVFLHFHPAQMHATPGHSMQH